MPLTRAPGGSHCEFQLPVISLSCFSHQLPEVPVPLSHISQIFSLSVAFYVQYRGLYCRSRKIAKCELAQGTPLLQCRAKIFFVGLISLETDSCQRVLWL